VITDYQAPLELAAKSMIRFKKPERLIKMIIRMISQHVNISHGAVLLYMGSKNYYKLIESKGLKGKKIPVGFARLNTNSALIRIFEEKKVRLIDKDGVLIYRDILNMRDTSLGKLLQDVISQMEVFGAEACIPSYFKGQLLGVLLLGGKTTGEPFNRREIGLLVTLANDAAMAISNAQLIENLQNKIEEVKQSYIREHRLFIHTSIALATAIDAKDQYTHGHTARVTRYSLEIFSEMKMKQCTEEALHIAALLHDIGKIGVPDTLLKGKKGLKQKDREQFEQHAITGAIILGPIRELGGIINGVKHHHERYDGKGYPDKLKKEDIPYISRIIAVADTFDAMTTDRPYRKAIKPADAVSELATNSGTQFDPSVVSAFMRAYKKGRIVPGLKAT